MTFVKKRVERILGNMTDRLYGLVAPFVMNPEVIRQNDGYPLYNTGDHVWYIAITGRRLVRGFLLGCRLFWWHLTR
jgi:hypothetical protein